MSVSIEQLMQKSGVGFGTSGARGLVSQMTDFVCYAYTTAFLTHLENVNDIESGTAVAVGGDLRPSSPRIMAAAMQAVADLGYKVINCGFVPSPALANFGLIKDIPTVMVTGSHIPDDRNGIKFNTRHGEITKVEEQGIKALDLDFNEELFTEEGALKTSFDVPPVKEEAMELFVKRFTDFYGKDLLSGMRLGFYQHSTVGRDVFPSIMEKLGAEVIRFSHSDVFIPVDTEAIRPEDSELALKFASENKIHAVISADGDCDRPLLSDENGEWLRGDVLGILAAQGVGATAVATPVSCNSAVEKCGIFDKVQRTRIGSPFVIAGMEELANDSSAVVVGYEANGGFLTQTAISSGDSSTSLAPLATRDAVLPVVSVLKMAKEQGKAVSALLQELPARYTLSNRLKEFPTERSKSKIAELLGDSSEQLKENFENAFGVFGSPLSEVDQTDGVRLTMENGDVIHLRPSGNAPELRCYNEAETPDQVAELNDKCMKIIESWR